MLISERRAAVTPRAKLLPVRLVKTFRPCPSRSSTTIFAVVVFPFVPLTTTTPCGSVAKTSRVNNGSIFSITSPGNAEPPPRRRVIFRTTFPIAAICGFGIDISILRRY